MMKENIFKYFDNVILSKTLNENSTNKRTIITDEDELISLFKSDYSEALNQVEVIKKLKCEGWLLTLMGYMGCRNYCIVCVNERIRIV